mmetsp:Transcript_2464/g.7654  ORF Transcript_2464/g.7654 Transcript_2464/m.7654 type:complete len:202 (+) Transcript_2464:136-741(+)
MARRTRWSAQSTGGRKKVPTTRRRRGGGGGAERRRGGLSLTHSRVKEESRVLSATEDGEEGALRRGRRSGGCGRKRAASRLSRRGKRGGAKKGVTRVRVASCVVAVGEEGMCEAQPGGVTMRTREEIQGGALSVLFCTELLYRRRGASVVTRRARYESHFLAMEPPPPPPLPPLPPSLLRFSLRRLICFMRISRSLRAISL